MRILLIGYGKMGKTIERLAKDKGHQIVGTVDIDNEDSLPEMLASADVAIEFTSPETAYQNIITCLRSNVPVVSGTTGWLDKFDDVVAETKRENGTFFYAFNYSIGVNIFLELNKHLAKLMNNFTDYDVLMEEIHHTGKKDAPSGTAISLAEDVVEHLERKKSWLLNEIGSADELGIYSKRVGKVFGIHEIQYHSDVDTIKIAHEAFGREGFASGAIRAAEWSIGKKGVYGMKDMLGLGP